MGTVALQKPAALKAHPLQSQTGEVGPGEEGVLHQKTGEGLLSFHAVGSLYGEIRGGREVLREGWGQEFHGTTSEEGMG